MRISTYNVRVTKPEDIKRGRAFVFRLPRILKNVKRVNADVLTFQEVQWLHYGLLKLFLPKYKIKWSKFEDVNGGNAIAAKRKLKPLHFNDIKVPTKRTASSLLLKINGCWTQIVSLHLSIYNNKMDDIKAIAESILCDRSILAGDLNILADDDNNEVFKYLRDKGYSKLNDSLGGFHGYGDSDKTPTTVDNFFTTFGKLKQIDTIHDTKASDHDIMWIDLNIK